MSFWRLSSPDNFTELALASHHIAWLCALAFLVATFSASVLLSVMQRYHHSIGQARRWWLAAGSIVMGTGIWAMHFIGMLAFSLPVPVDYNWTITLASILPAILASGAFQALYRTRDMSQARMVTISLIMAVGIGIMHYMGMEAVIVSADMHYEPGLFLLSILAAVLLAYCAVFAQSRLVSMKWFSQWQTRVIGSVTLGLAVTLMHFIAMSATYFQPNELTVVGPLTSAPISLVIEVIAITAVLILVAAISTVVERRMEDMAARLHNSEARFQSLAESTQTAIFTLTAERITYANPALCRLTHLNLEELYSRSLEEIFDHEFRNDIAELLKAEAESERVIHQEIRIHDLDDNEKWLFCSLTRQEIDASPIVLASAFDITEQKNTAIKMQHLAYSDHLTNLHNRMVFMDRLQHHLDSMARNDSANTACVMIVDLDGFKQINESLGHVQGDKLLITVGKRLQKLARSTDTMSRFGGDEFVLLFEQIANSLDIDTIAERVLNSISGPVKLNKWVIDVSASIGIVEVTQHYKSPDEVLHDADIALYRAKALGSGGWVLFDEELDSAAKRKRMLLPQLKRAIELKKLQMYFQPICSATNGAVRGFEALARWTMDNGEFVSPGEFIPLAEEAGLIHDIGLWALESAAIQIHTLNQLYADEHYYVSVNIDAGTLDDSRFLGKVVSVFRDYSLQSGQLKIELTERGLIRDTEAIIPKMQELIAQGCEFMIDDFGTGYSSLSYLHKLPIHTLKIDRSFVLGLDESETSEAVVKTIITLSESLGLNVVAEGVETIENVVQLASLNCHQLQGYYFSRPMPASEVEGFLKEHELLSSALYRQAGSFPGEKPQPLN